MEIKPKKSLGQNFLKDSNIIKQIVDVGNISEDNTVIEVGPGTGNLTEFILKKKPKKFFVIEKDSNLVSLLKKKFSKNINIINEDILKIDLKEISNDKIIVFGNLPYNISTRILTQWIINSEKSPFYKKLVLMFQKEVADRILAKTNSQNYGRLSIITNWKLNIKREFNISSGCFFPKPRVDSTLLSFVPRKDFFDIQHPKNIEKITRIFFNQKRKMIKNPFKQIFKEYETIAKIFKIDLNLRPQNISNQIYYKICYNYEKSLK